MMDAILLSRSHEIAAWIEHEMRDFPAPASLRTRCAGPCFVVAQEHHQAVVLLLSQPHPFHASAFALVRPVYESLVRGLWLQHCATAEQVQSFSIGGRPPNVPTLLAAIMKTEAYSSGQLSAVYAKSWDVMCAYTHTGAQQVQPWNTGTAIEPNYSDADASEVLRCTGAFALLSIFGLAAIADNKDLALRTLVKSREWAEMSSNDALHATCEDARA